MAISGVALGIVSDVQDPLARKRVKVRFPWAATADSSDWLLVCIPFGAAGLSAQPKTGDSVVVGFMFGKEENAIVLGKVAGV